MCGVLGEFLSIYVVGDFHCPITQERMRDPVVAAGELELLYI